MGAKDLESFLTKEELSKWLKISENTINNYVVQDKIPSYKVGRIRLFDPVEIRKWMTLNPKNTMSKSRAKMEEERRSHKSRKD